MSEIYISPIGIMGIQRTHDVFLSLLFGEYTGTPIEIPELDNYFLGKQKSFSLPFKFLGTAFQMQVWNSLLKIPYGQTTTYQSIANQIGAPKAVRAVANAIAANPLHILVPCHRVIRTDGTIGGYRGGLMRKKQMLNLESLIIT